MSPAEGNAAPRALLHALFRAAVAAADPAACLPPLLPPPPPGRTVVVGAGKAAAAMARAVEDHWPADRPLSGVVVTRYGHAVPTRRIAVIAAAHPVPDAAGLAAAARIRAAVGGLGPDDLVLCLLSGGGSALLADPLPPLDLAGKQALARALLASGAPIGAINCVRRHLSGLKGGRLGAACAPARLVTLAISDVPGDDPAAIASGPTVADPSTCADALAVLDGHAIVLPPAVRALLASGAAETVKPGDPRLTGSTYVLAATPRMALDAAAREAARHGLAAHILGDAIEGESREAGRVLAGIARAVAAHGQPFAPPCVLLSGGETTVRLEGGGAPAGVGGPNVEFLLGLGAGLAGHPGIHALAADTDGVDGAAEIAGAWLHPDTPARAAAVGRSYGAALAAHDGHGFFGALGDSLETGPTLTNVNDFRAILIAP